MRRAVLSQLIGRPGCPARGVCCTRNNRYRIGCFQPVQCWGLQSIPSADKEASPMLWTIFVILLILWLLGLVSSYTLGGFIHLLLVLALVVLLIQLITGRRPSL